MKTKYILHGGYTCKDNDQNTEFFTECFVDAPEKAKMLIVLFAKEGGGDKEYYRNLCNRLEKFTDKEILFEKASEESFVSQARQADIIFLQGGHTNLLLEKLKKYSDFLDIITGKTVIGSSAGAYALGTLGADHSGEHMREGLGILPLRVVCHYESDKLPPSDTSLEEIRNTRTDFELVLLRDFEHKVFYGRAI